MPDAMLRNKAVPDCTHMISLHLHNSACMTVHCSHAASRRAAGSPVAHKQTFSTVGHQTLATHPRGSGRSMAEDARAGQGAACDQRCRQGAHFLALAEQVPHALGCGVRQLDGRLPQARSCAASCLGCQCQEAEARLYHRLAASCGTLIVDANSAGTGPGSSADQPLDRAFSATSPTC